MLLLHLLIDSYKMDKTSQEYIEFLELVMPNLHTVDEEDYEYQI